MAYQLTKRTAAVVSAAIKKLEASALPGLADNLTSFISSEERHRQEVIDKNRGREDWHTNVWEEYEDAICCRIYDLLNEARTKQ